MFGGDFILDFITVLKLLPSIFPITGAVADILGAFGLFKIWRITRIKEIIDKLTITAAEKALLKMVYILYLLILYHHVIACFLWFSFKHHKQWVPPKDFGYLIFDYMETNTVLYSLLENYMMMFYYSCFIFNGVDIAPIEASEILFVTFLMIISAFANALLYGTFFNMRD